MECDSTPCERAPECRTLPLWQKLNDMINDYLDNVTIADLMKEEQHQIEEKADQ